MELLWVLLVWAALSGTYPHGIQIIHTGAPL